MFNTNNRENAYSKIWQKLFPSILPVEDLLCLQQELHVTEEHWPIDFDEELEDHQFGLVEVKSWSYYLCAW